jgi:3-oxoacyl-[acyl-carrier-protein] synthase II
MKAYIRGMGNISPQQTWGDKALLPSLKDYSHGRFTCIEPDYSVWIDPKHSRRMSRIIKMGVASAFMALKEAEVLIPDAIITGTGYGCMEDTGAFLNKMTANNEQALNPTPFIQSTHNTIGSQIALLLQCQEYNQTYTQGAFSFESALLDSMLLLAENPSKHMLVGGVDEITDVSHTIQKRFNIFRPDLKNSLDLFKQPDKGTLHGEGSAFFVLSGEQSPNDKGCIQGVTTFYKPDVTVMESGIADFLARASLRIKDIDLILLGKSGDDRYDSIINSIEHNLFKEASVGVYKHLCGEFPVASSFALWLAVSIVHDQQLSEIVITKNTKRAPKNILIYNQYFNTQHSLILVKSC